MSSQVWGTIAVITFIVMIVGLALEYNVARNTIREILKGNSYVENKRTNL